MNRVESYKHQWRTLENLSRKQEKQVQLDQPCSGGLPGVAALPKLVGGVLPAMATAGGGGGSGSVVMASVLPSSRSQVMAAAKSGKGVLQVTAPPQPCEC